MVDQSSSECAAADVEIDAPNWSMPFLMNFTDGRTLSLVDRFDLHGDQNAISFENNTLPGLFLPPLFEDATLYGVDLGEDGPALTPVRSLELDEAHTTNTKFRCSRACLEELVSGLRACHATHAHMPRSEQLHRDFDFDNCVLFEPEMASRLVDSYFRKWHCHAPIIHRPTFDANRAQLPQLAAIIMMGAMFYARHTTVLATEWLDLIETYVFEHQDFRNISEGDGMHQTQATFEVLQAAVIVVIMQDWGHDLESRRRMRLHRYIDVVSVARSMRIFSITHPDLEISEHGLSEQEWLRYSRVEAQIRYTPRYVFIVFT